VPDTDAVYYALSKSKDAEPMQPVLSCMVPEVVRCAERGDVAAVSGLLDQGEDPSCPDDFGLTALHGASKKDRQEVVALLLARRADANRRSCKGLTPMHYACKYGRADVVRMLLAGRGDPTAVADDGLTPQEYALSKRHSNILEILTHSMANP
jgi:ankyrin repeat protein